jgi:hypothetical protein
VLELAAQKGCERRFARHRRTRAGNEQADGGSVRIVGRIERRHDADAGRRSRGRREQGEDDEDDAHRAILASATIERMSAADALPEYHHRERHSVHVAASPERALAAAREVTLDEVPLTRWLFRVRGLAATAPGGRLWDLLTANSFAQFDDETFVLVGRPWQLGGARRPEVDDFLAFAEPGYAKMTLDLRAFPDGGGAWLTTETRVLLTDARARRRFAAYWLVIRPFSGLTRRGWLKAAKRRAESA